MCNKPKPIEHCEDFKTFVDDSYSIFSACITPFIPMSRVGLGTAVTVAADTITHTHTQTYALHEHTHTHTHTHTHNHKVGIYKKPAFFGKT